MLRHLFLLAVLAFGSACGGSPATPPTAAETVNRYGYHPIDPIPVRVDNLERTRILDALSDETMRLAVEELGASVDVNAGPVSATVKGKTYSVIADYVKYVTLPLREVRNRRGRTTSVTAPNPYELDSGVAASMSEDESENVVPLYVGVGVRVVATVTAKEEGIQLTSLMSIGVAARANQLSGTLCVQTLGLSGEDISALLPVPSDLNETTIQNALMAMGQIKGKIYDAKTNVSPQVVGYYDSLGSARGVPESDAGSDAGSDARSDARSEDIILKIIAAHVTLPTLANAILPTYPDSGAHDAAFDAAAPPALPDAGAHDAAAESQGGRRRAGEPGQQRSPVAGEQLVTATCSG
jgi:hypothetical protein